MAEALADLRQKYNAVIIFLYLCEAQARDSWPLSTNAPNNHTSLEERVSAGQKLLAEHPGFAQQLEGWYVDDMDDATTIANGFWPERYVFTVGGKVVWASTIAEATGTSLPDDFAATAASVFAA